MAEVVHFRQLQHAAETKAVLQLHRYAKANGAPVFSPGQYAAVQEVLQQHHPRSLCYCALACEQPPGAGGAQGEEQLVGAAVGLQDEGCVEVVSCVVRADWRGRGGIGRRLMGALLSQRALQEEVERQNLEGPGTLKPPASAPLQAASQSPAAGLLHAHTPPSAASTGAAETYKHARCWVPPAHPFHGLLCKHMGFVPSPRSMDSRTGGTPGYALPGSQLLVKVAVPSPMDSEQEIPMSSQGEISRLGVSTSTSDTNSSSRLRTSSSNNSSTNSSATPPLESPAPSVEPCTTQISPHATSQPATPGDDGPAQPDPQQPGLAVNSLAVREVGLQDKEAVLALHRDAVYQGKPVFGRQGLPAVQAMLELTAHGSSDLIVLVAESCTGQILGACTGELEFKSTGPAGAGPVLVVLTLVVGEQAKRQGVGALLLRAMVEEGRARGAARVETDVATINQPALQLFGKEGFVSKSKPDSDTSTRAGRRSSPDDASSDHTTSRKGGGFGGEVGAAKAHKKGSKKVRAPSGGAQPHAPASIEMVLDLWRPESDQAHSSAPSASVGTPGTAPQDGLDWGAGKTGSASASTTAASHGCSRDSVWVSKGAAAAGPVTSVRMPRPLLSFSRNKLPCPSRSTSKLCAPLRLI